MNDSKILMYKRALAREKAARKEAEKILEDKSRELYFKSEELKVSNLKLENLVLETTSELQGVFENIVDAYVVISSKGHLIKMNKAAEKLLGYSADDNIILNELVHPDHREKVAIGFKILFERGAITNLQFNIVIANGESRLVQINASVILNQSSQPIAAQGIVRDITEEKAAAQRIIDSENRLSSLISHLDSGVLMFNEDRKILYANTQFCNFFQIPGDPELLLNSEIDQMINSKLLIENPKEFLARINELTLKKEQVLSEEIHFKNGQIYERDFVPINEEGKSKGFLWTYRDVTLHRNYRKIIEAEREKYMNIIANMNLGLVEVNTDDEILMVNHSFLKISGYSEEELVGRIAKDVLLIKKSQEDLIKVNKNRLEGLANSYEVEALTKSGEPRHWLISGAPNYDINGRVVGSIGVHLDITELKNLEIQKGILLKKLKKSNVELEEYAHVVSHDLKSPLRNINALVNWIREDNQDILTQETLSHISMIETTLEKMEYLISDVLEYSSAGSVSAVLEDVNINYVLNDIKTLLHCPDHIRLNFNKNLPFIKADKIKLYQLFQNLLSNAIRYCDKNQGLVTVDFIEEEDHYTFSVQDNGIGIPKEYHNKIFKIFQTLNTNKESTGIGLAIVKKIVELYGGTIWVESTVGVGSTFYFTLPKTIILGEA